MRTPACVRPVTLATRVWRPVALVHQQAFCDIMEPLTAEVLALLDAEGAHFQGTP